MTKRVKLSGVVLDALAHDREAVDLGGEAARDRGAVRVRHRLANGGRRRRRLDELRAAEVLREPQAALPERLRMRVHALDRREVRHPREQALRHFELELGADEQIVRDERVDRVRHGALGRVLDRQDAVLRLAPRHRVEDPLERRRLEVRGREAEEPARRRVRERPLGPEVRHLEGLLEREARAHDLAVHRADRVGRETPGARREPVEHLALAIRVVRRQVRFLLRTSHLADDARPVVEELQDSFIELVDAFSQVVESHGGATLAHGCR